MIVKPGRNDPCPCGSGKKYKKCCQDRIEARQNAPVIPAQRPAPTGAEIDRLVALFNAGHHAELESLARELLERHPDSGFVWKVLSSTLQAMGKDALAATQRAAQLLPDDAEQHYNLGVALQALGQLDKAAACYRRTLEIRPDLAEACCNLGAALHGLGQLDEAVASYCRAVEINPAYAEAHSNLGNALRALGRPDDAMDCCRRAIAIRPAYARAHSNLGNALCDLEHVDEAVASYRRAIEIEPGFAEAHSNLGNALGKLGQMEAAVASYRRALAIRPDFAEAACNLGAILRDLGRPDEAAAACRRALEISPGFAEAHNNLGSALQALRQPHEAVASYRRALEINPGYAEACNNLGNALRDLGRPDEGAAACRRALEIRPGYAEAYSNLGNALQALGEHAQALENYRRALEINPDFAEAGWNLGLTFLALGQFRHGWPGYEMRWKLKGAERLPETPYPHWLGEEDIRGRKLLIQFEQGLGDAIQMLRYVPLLQQENVECWIQVPDCLHGLISRSFPHARIIAQHHCPDGLDYRVPVMSLPLAMRTFSEQSIPAPAAYLTPDDHRVMSWQQKLASTRSKTIGLVWRGSPGHKNDHNRSASLTDLLPLIAAHESIQFVSLQKGLTQAERNALEGFGNVRMLDEELLDFDETAAAMCNMDLVISVDSAPAHLSGALGKSTWVLLPFSAEWRWLTVRTDSPWYPGATLFRQNAIGNWAGVVGNLQASLAGVVDQF
jgi:tetratricopeptide (TPR) repeat protein